MTYQMSIHFNHIKYFHKGNTFEVIVIEYSLPDIPKLFLFYANCERLWYLEQKIKGNIVLKPIFHRVEANKIQQYCMQMGNIHLEMLLDAYLIQLHKNKHYD